MIKPTMSMAVNKVHLSELLFDYYKKKSEMLDDLFLTHQLRVETQCTPRECGFITYTPEIIKLSFTIPTTKYDSLMEAIHGPF